MMKARLKSKNYIEFSFYTSLHSIIFFLLFVFVLGSSHFLLFFTLTVQLGPAVDFVHNRILSIAEV